MNPVQPPRDPDERRLRGRRSLVVAALFTVVLAFAAWAWTHAAGDLLSTSLGPVAVLPEASTDDDAGDSPSVKPEDYLPLPDIFSDERVLAALGPLTRLSCDKDDPDTLEA